MVLGGAQLGAADEVWASTNLAQRYGRCRHGYRLRVGSPHGHWQTTTIAGAFTTRGLHRTVGARWPRQLGRFRDIHREGAGH